MDVPPITDPHPGYLAAVTALYVLELERHADQARTMTPHHRRARAYRRAQAKRAARRVIHAR